MSAGNLNYNYKKNQRMNEKIPVARSISSEYVEYEEVSQFHSDETTPIQ